MNNSELFWCETEDPAPAPFFITRALIYLTYIYCITTSTFYFMNYILFIHFVHVCLFTFERNSIKKPILPNNVLEAFEMFSNYAKFLVWELTKGGWIEFEWGGQFPYAIVAWRKVHNMMQYNIIWYNMRQHDTIWHNMMQNDTILYTFTLFLTICGIRYSMVQYHMTWCDTIQCGTISYNV